MPRAQRVLLRVDGPGAIGAIDVGDAKQALLTVGWAALLGISYYFAARLGLGFRFQNSQIGVVWPANGLFLAALLLTSRNKWWIVCRGNALLELFLQHRPREILPNEDKLTDSLLVRLPGLCGLSLNI